MKWVLINYLKKIFQNVFKKILSIINNYNVDKINDISIINKGLGSKILKLNDQFKTNENEIVNFLHNYLIKRKIKIYILKNIQLIYTDEANIEKIKEHLEKNPEIMK